MDELEIAAARLNYAQDFYNEVCRRAEKNMEKTGKLEGAHYAAMQQVLSEYRQDYAYEKSKQEATKIPPALTEQAALNRKDRF